MHRFNSFAQGLTTKIICQTRFERFFSMALWNRLGGTVTRDIVMLCELLSELLFLGIDASRILAVTVSKGATSA